MRTPVKCLNCGMKWVRGVALDTDTTELITDLQYYCPKCGSNYYVELPEKERNNND